MIYEEAKMTFEESEKLLWEPDCPYFEEDFCKLDNCLCESKVGNIRDEHWIENCMWRKGKGSEVE